MAAKRLKPDNATTIPVTLTARERISPSFLRLTLTGEKLANYQVMGADQWFRLFLPTESDDRASGPPGKVKTLPDMGVRSMASYALSPPSRRPLIRNYTTAEFRPADPAAGRATAELDFDVYVDDSHTGPGLRWALDAALGSPAALLDEGRLYAPPARSAVELLVGDESALPALAGVLRDAPPELTGVVVVEVKNQGDVRDLPGPSGVEVAWEIRGDDDPGARAAAHVRERGVPDGLTYSYLAGPSSMVTGLRRFLVRDSGVPKDLVSFTGYWR